MPLNTKIGGQARHIKDREAFCLIEDQPKHIYKKVETEYIVNLDTMKQKIEAHKLDQIDDNNDKINPYHKIITNKVEKDNAIISQMEQWSILSYIINYVQYDRHQKISLVKYKSLQIKRVIRKYSIKKRKGRC